jgi:hypothetical protein
MSSLNPAKNLIRAEGAKSITALANGHFRGVTALAN